MACTLESIWHQNQGRNPCDKISSVFRFSSSSILVVYLNSVLELLTSRTTTVTHASDDITGIAAQAAANLNVCSSATGALLHGYSDSESWDNRASASDTSSCVINQN